MIARSIITEKNVNEQYLAGIVSCIVSAILKMAKSEIKNTVSS